MRLLSSKILAVTIGLSLMTPLLLQAKEATVRINLRGTLVEPPPCTIVAANPIDVFFTNEVMTTRVNGRNYITAVNYDLNCTEAVSNSLKLKISGTVSSFDSSVLKTIDKPDLGIQFYSGDTKLNLNEWFNFRYPDKPNLLAAPTKRDGSILTSGAFTATATLHVDYQ